MVAQYDGFARSKRFGDAITFLEVEDDTGVVGEHTVRTVEGARVLGQRFERASGCRPDLSVGRVRVHRGNDVRSGLVQAGVDGECRPVQRSFAFSDQAVRID